ncbi:MAG TPA: vWA domain-containing protein [Thermoanaerobaculia bacterium]|nr:vWA domain-containing protein [Thermoanaerobaculia bacterium]
MSGRLTRCAKAAAFVFLLGSEAGAVTREGLDLVLLVDRSKSMARQDVRDLLLSFTVGMVGWSSDVNQVSHRIAVVSFGSKARIDLPLSEAPAIRTIRSPASLGNTDFLSAFRAAADVLGPSSADPQRRRVILLITDGVPYGPRGDPGVSIQELRRFLPSLCSSTQIALHVFMTPSPGQARERYRRIWREIAQGRVHELAGDRMAILTTLHEAVSQVFGTRFEESRSAPEGGAIETVVLPPYLELVVFDIVAGSSGGEVEIFTPDAPHRPLLAGASGVEEVRLGRFLRTVAVRRPAMGRWLFRKPHPGARVKVLSQQFFPRGMLLEPGSERRIRQHGRISLAYRLIDRGGSPLREIPGYPLSLSLSLVRPDGRRSALPMRRRAPGVFRSRQEAVCDLSGRYWTEAEIVTRDLEDRRVEVFRDHWSGFAVHRASRIDCRVTVPRPRQLVSFGNLFRRRVATRLECLDDAARPADLEAVVRGPLDRLFAPALSREGRRTAAALDLAPLGQGVLAGSLRGAAAPGSYRLELKVDEARLAGDYSIRIVPPAVHFVSYLSWSDYVQFSLLGVALVLPLAKISRRYTRGARRT